MYVPLPKLQLPGNAPFKQIRVRPPCVAARKFIFIAKYLATNITGRSDGVPKAHHKPQTCTGTSRAKRQGSRRRRLASNFSWVKLMSKI